MARKNMILVDAANQTAVDDWEFSAKGVKLVKKRLTAGLSAGVDVLEVDNGRFAMTILLTRGMGIWRGKCGDMQLQWASPVKGPVHPAFVPVSDGSGVGWLYGFDEWLVRCGLENNGSPQFNEQGTPVYTLHGQLANTPASYVEVSFDLDSGEIAIEGTVYESRLFSKRLELKTRYLIKVGEPGFRMRDTVTNLSASSKEIVLLYHINTGLPFLGNGSRAVVPFEEMAPRSPAAADDLPNWERCDVQEKAGQEEVVFFFEPAANAHDDTEVMLINGNNDRAVSLGFNKKQLPYFTFWKSRLPAADGHVVGIEPTVNFPNTTGFESKQGRTVLLQPNESRAFDLRFAFLQNKNEVDFVEQRIRELHATAQGKVFDSPHPEWSE